jgi:hypothetical protein
LPAIFQSVLTDPVQIFVFDGTGVAVGVLVGVRLGVAVGPAGVAVGVVVAVALGVRVGVRVGVFVGVRVGVFVGVLVGVPVGVAVGVIVGVIVGEEVGVAVIAGVAVQAKILGEFVVLADTGRPTPVSVALAATRSVIKVSLPPQAGAVSFRLPEQVSVALPFGPSAVTAVPFWVQETAEGVPPG